MMPQENHYVELSFDMTDPGAFMAWARTHVPTALLADPQETPAGTILVAVMRMANTIPGLKCYGGGAHTRTFSSEDLMPRRAVFEEPVYEDTDEPTGADHPFFYTPPDNT